MKVEFSIFESIMKAVKKYGKTTVLFSGIIFALFIMFQTLMTQNEKLFDKFIIGETKTETQVESKDKTPSNSSETATTILLIVVITMSVTVTQCLLFQHKKMMIKLFDEREHDHNKNIHKRRLANSEIDLELKQLLYKIDSDTTFIGEYHNGNKNLGGLSFLKFSITYEQDGEDINPIFKNYQDMNLSNFKLFGILNKKYYTSYNIESLKDNDKLMYYILYEEGVRQIFLCEIRSLNRPLGFIGATFSKEDVNSVVIQKDIMEIANKLSVLLTYDKN